MRKSIYDPRYESVIALLRSRREELKLRQADVAAKMHWSLATLSRVERCQRRLDLLEMMDLIKHLGLSMQQVEELCCEKTA